MKKTAAVLLTLILLLSAVLPVTAFAETKVTLAKKAKTKDGLTTITWSVSGTEPASYWVWAKCVSGDAQSRFLLGTTVSHKISTGMLMPGKKYEITVSNITGTVSATKKYTIPKAEEFKDEKLKSTSIKVTMAPVKNSWGKYTSPKSAGSLKAKTIKKGLKNKSEIYSVKYQFKMPRLSKARDFLVSIFIEAPNGFLKCVFSRDVEFNRVNNGYQTLWLEMLDGDFFEDLYEATKEIPEGKYKVTMYWDGMLVNSSSFSVK